MCVMTFQYEISGKNHICSVKTFSSRYNLPIWEKKFIGTSSILAWVKVVCCLHYQVLHAKQPSRKLVSGFSFACNKYPPQFTDDKSNDSSMREGIPLDALNWFGRGYELHTPKSVGCEGSKAWALSVVPHFPLSSTRVAFSCVGWFSSALAFRSLYYPWGKTGDYSQSRGSYKWVRGLISRSLQYENYNERRRQKTEVYDYL